MSIVLLLLACGLTCLGQVAQKLAVESWRGRITTVPQKLRSVWMWLALLSLGSGLCVWLLVLQRMEVGVAYPMLSLNFVLITLIARFGFKEVVDRRHWLGVGLVICGVVLLGQHS